MNGVAGGLNEHGPLVVGGLLNPLPSGGEAVHLAAVGVVRSDAASAAVAVSDSQAAGVVTSDAAAGELS